MLSLSYVWLCMLKQSCTSSLAPMAYADNLGWKTSEPEDHSLALRQTEKWAQALRFQIDWAKTWVWATGPIHKETWKRISGARPIQLHWLTNARELGYMMAYNKKHSKLTFKQRMQDALHQLSKLARLPHDMQTKALLTKAPLSKAVYATEICAVGHQHFAKLRTAITRALLGPYTQANPYVAMVTLSRFVQDPVVVFAMHCIRQLRLFLGQQDSEVQKSFFLQAATHSGEPLRVRGPAGALKYNLQNLNLGLDKHGRILVDGFVALPLLTTPLEQIRVELVPDEISTRRDWTRAPIVDEGETKRLLATFPSSAQKILAFEITGAYQTARQKVKWTQMEQPLCPLCQENDSVEHRRLWCPALQATRNEHSEIAAELQEMHSIVVTLPVIYQHHLCTLERCLAWKAPKMQPNLAVLEAIQTQIDQDHRPLIFTDGSAAPPDMASVRKAAFAIVFLPYAAEQHPQKIVDVFERDRQIPEAFCTDSWHCSNTGNANHTSLRTPGRG